jgi:hypothetical protein
MFQHDNPPLKSIDINCVMISKFHNFFLKFFFLFWKQKLWNFSHQFNMCENLIFHQRKGEKDYVLTISCVDMH